MIRLLVCLFVCSVSQSVFAQPGAFAQPVAPATPPPQNASEQKLVAVRVAVLEANKELHLKEGANLSAANLDELIAKMRGEGLLDAYQFFNLASLENQQAMIQFGQEESILTGRMFTSSRGGSASFGGGPGASPVGRISNSYQRENTGSILTVASRVRADGQIIVELNVNSTRFKPTPAPKDTADSADAAGEINTPKKKVLSCQTTVVVAPGVSTVIAAGGNDQAGESSRDYIIVTATAK